MLITWGSQPPWWDRAPCAAQITTPVDTTVTIPTGEVYCSTGAIVVDSVAAGAGIVEINGAWRLT